MTHRIKGCKTTADENKIFNQGRKTPKGKRKNGGKR